MTEDFTDRKTRAARWFRQLRNDIVAAFEGLEQSHAAGLLSAAAPGDRKSVV